MPLQADVDSRVPCPPVFLATSLTVVETFTVPDKVEYFVVLRWDDPESAVLLLLLVLQCLLAQCLLNGSYCCLCLLHTVYRLS